MPSALRNGLLVGGLCLLVLLSAPALADDVQHEHPDEADGNDDLEGVERWLGDRMGEIHADCADGIGIESFDACEDLDEEYTDLLRRYATVENDLEDGPDAETATRYNETRAQQREYAALKAEFETTYDEYEAARAAGNDAEARSSARELLRLADRLEELGGEIEGDFVELDNTTTADLTAASRSINESTNEVRTVAFEAETESFEAAEIDAAVGDAASFADPQTVSGRVTAENGAGIADAEIVLTDGAQSFATTTTENGSYELSYRPTRTRVGATDLTVRYRPAQGDPYLGAETTETTEVRATDSALRIENSSSDVAFGDRLVVTGAVRAGNASVPDVDVALYADSERLTTTRTDADGSFRAVTRVPATLATGTRTLDVRASEPDRAIRQSVASIEPTVSETATELEITAASTDGEIDVSGRLRSDAETPVGTRPISVQIGDETDEIRTDPDGRYRLATEHASEPETVTATYNETGTNLARSQATVEYESADAASSSPADRFLSTARNSALGIVLAGIVVTVALLVAIYRSRSRDATDARSGSSQPVPSTESDAAVSDGSTESSVESRLDIARRKLRTDPQATVYASYAAVRALFDASDDQTHWELYEQQRPTEDDRTDDAFYTLTETFERAAFAADDVDAAQAESALRAAERYLDAADPGGSTD